MAIIKRKPDGGRGGKRGHSNMDHWMFTDEIKAAAKKARRLEAKERIAAGMKELSEDLYPRAIAQLRIVVSHDDPINGKRVIPRSSRVHKFSQALNNITSSSYLDSKPARFPSTQGTVFKVSRSRDFADP